MTPGRDTVLAGTLVVLGTVGILGAGLLLAPVSAPISATVAEGDSMGHDGQNIVFHSSIGVDPGVGDAIIFEANDQRVHHRIVGDTAEGFITKGDANDITDQNAEVNPDPHITSEHIQGKALVVVPFGAALVGLLALLALIGLAGASMYRRHLTVVFQHGYASLQTVSEHSPSAQRTAAVAFALLLVLSGVGPFASMGGLVVEDHGGTASAATWTLNDTYTGHSNDIESVTMGPDGYVYSGSSDNTVHKINPDTMGTVATYTGHSDSINSIKVGPDGYLYSTSLDGQVHKVNTSDMSQAGVYTGHNYEPLSVAVGPNGYVYSGENINGNIHKIDPSDMSQVSTYNGHSDTVKALTASSDGYLYSGSNDNTVHKIDLSDMSQAATYTGHSSSPRAVTMGDGGHVYSGSGSEVHKINPSDMSQAGVYTGHTNTVMSVTMGADGYLYSGGLDNEVHRVDPSDMSQSDTYTGHTNTVTSLTGDSDGYVYSGDIDNEIYKTDPGTTVGQPLNGTVTDAYGNSLSNATVDIVNSSTGTTTASKTTDSSGYYQAEVDAGSYDITVSHPSDDITKTRTVDVPSGGLTSNFELGELVSGTVTDSNGNVVSGATVEIADTSGTIEDSATSDVGGDYAVIAHATGDREVTATNDGYTSDTQTVSVADSGTSGVNLTLKEAVVSGQVIDQYDSPQSGVQVRGYAIDTTNRTFEQAKNELQNLSDLEPPSWKDKSEFDLEAEAHNLETEYVTVNTRDQWQLNQVGGLSGVSLTPPVVHHKDPTKPLVFSTWDPTTGGAVINSEINGEWPGTQTDSKIVIERLDGEDDVVDRTVISQNGTKTTGILSDTRWDGVSVGGVSAGTDHSYAQTTLSPGFYVVYSKKAGQDGPRTFLRVGTFDSMIDQTVRDEAGNLPEQAKAVQNRINNNEMQVLTAETGPDGKYTLDPPSGYDTVTIQVFGIQSGNVSLDQQSDMSDVRAVYDQESFDGSVTMQAEPVITEVPNHDADVRVLTTATPPWLGMNSTENFAERLRNYLENRSFSELPSVMQERIEEMQPEEQNDLHEELRQLQERNERLRQQYLDELQDDGYESPPSPEEMNNEELRQDIRRLENTISQMQSNIDMEDGSGDVSSSGNLTYEKPLPDGVSEDSVSVIAEFNDGTSDVVNESYWRIEESAGGLGTNTLVVEDYPLDGVAVAEITVRVVSDDEAIIGNPDAGFGQDSDTIRNPAFEGQTPDINAIDFSTLEPGPDEQVTMNVRAPPSSSFQSVQNVSAWGPNGNAIDVNTSGMHDATFRTVGEGRHSIQITYTDATGETFVETVSILASDSERALPASVRVYDGTSDDYALTGSGLSNGYVRKSSTGPTRVGAVISQDADVPSTVHVFTQSTDASASNEYEVRVQRGEDRESVKRHVTVSMNTRKISEDALVWRNGDAIDAAGSSPYGVVKHNYTDKTKIRFATGEHGRATIRINNDPGRLERLEHWWGLNGPGFLTGMIAPTADLLAAVPSAPDGTDRPTSLPVISWPIHPPLAVSGGVTA